MTERRQATPAPSGRTGARGSEPLASPTCERTTGTLIALHAVNAQARGRGWFADAGFEELAYWDRLEGTSTRVGVKRPVALAQELQLGRHLFTFFR